MQKAVSSPGWLKSLTETHTPETIEYGISSFIYRQRKAFHPVRLFELIKTGFLIIENAGASGSFTDGVEDGESEDGESENSESEDDESEDDKLMDTESDIEKEDTDAEMEEGESDGEGVSFESGERDRVFECKNNSLFKHVLRSKGTLWISGKDQFLGIWSQAGIIRSISNEGKWFAERPDLDQFENELKKNILSTFDEDPAIGDRRQELVFIGDFANDEEKQVLRRALDSCLMKKGDEAVKEEDDDWEHWF